MKCSITLKIDNKLKILKHTNNCKKYKRLLIAKIGNIYDLNNNELSFDDIRKIYYEYKNKITNYLDGTYSLLIADYNINKLYIFQDPFGSSQNIYYYHNKNIILLSNELKEIIINQNNEWNFNKKFIKFFLKNGYVLGKNTLVKNIYKIPSKKNLEINLKNNRIRLINNEYLFKLKKSQVNNNIYIETLSNIISKIKFDNELAITSSSGYDTNLLLFLLRKISDKKINTFCVGGKKEK